MKGTRLTPLLYLDTARLGPMSPAAQRAQFDFVRLAAEEPSSLYFEQFLRDGFVSWPSAYQSRFPSLATWPGVAGLKQSLRTLAGAPDDWNVLLASRSLPLVRLATRSMFRVCRNVLTTDLSWPTYQRAIEQSARRAEARLTVIPLRDQVLVQRWTSRDVADHFAAAFANTDCDGLFLPAVDHLGIRMPIREIVAAIQRRRHIKFCFIDAAQAFCQVPIDDCFECADFVIAGSHKWLGGYLPAAIAWIKTTGGGPVAQEQANDPLFRFTEHLSRGKIQRQTETINITPLLTCSGAVHDRLVDSVWQGPPDDAEVREWTLAGWEPVRPVLGLRSQMVLLEQSEGNRRQPSADNLRRYWLRHGRVVTTYSGGRVRLSAPPTRVSTIPIIDELQSDGDLNGLRQSERCLTPTSGD